MYSLKALSIATVTAASLILFSGCSTAQKGAASAGLVGGVTGAVVGNNWVPVGPTTGAVIGGTSGAAIGGLVGDAYDQVTEKDIERELQNLRAELAQKERELASLRGMQPTPGIDQEEVDNLRAQVESLENLLAEARLNAEQGQGTNDALARAEADAQRLREELNNSAEIRERLENTIDLLTEEIEALRSKIENREATLASLNDKVDYLQTSLTGKESELAGLSAELENMNVELDQTSRGLTLTIVDEFLYKPGRAELSDSGKILIGDVAAIIEDRFPGRELLIEGHTDDRPIVHSGWKSNWELGAQRAMNLLHELVDYNGVDPSRVSATSYGEFRPATANDTREGRQQNRRAVIVILPEELPIERQQLASSQ